MIVPHSPPQMLKQRLVLPAPATPGNMHSLFILLQLDKDSKCINPAVQCGICVTLQKKEEAVTTRTVHMAKDLQCLVWDI